MRKSNFYLWVILFISISNSGYGQDWQWLNKIGTGTARNQCSTLGSATDGEGNTFVMGWYKGELTLGDNTYTGTSSSYTNYFLAKFDKFGNVIWSKAIRPENSSINIYKVEVDDDGNAYIIGTMSTNRYSNGIVNFDEGSFLSLYDQWDPYSGSRFICKYTSSGEVAMKKFYTGHHETNIASISVSRDGNILVKGTFLDTYTRNPSSYFSDDSIRCYSSSGALLWKKHLNFKQKEMRLISDNNTLWIISYNDSPQEVNFDDYIYNVAAYETLITGHDQTTGSLTTVSPTKQQLRLPYRGIDIVNDHLYLLGSFQAIGKPSISFGNFEVSTTKPQDTDYYGFEGYCAKYNIKGGEFEWSRLMSSFGDIWLMEISPSGNIYLGLGQNGTNSSQNVHKLNPMGDILWSQTSRAYIHDHISMGIDNSENVYVSGWVFSSFGTATFGNLNFKFDYEVGFIAKILNSNPLLSGLSIDNGILEPEFSQSFNNYSTTIGDSISSIVLTPTAFNSTSLISVNGQEVLSNSASSPIPIKVGANLINIDINAKDGSTKTYTINVNVEKSIEIPKTPIEKDTWQDNIEFNTIEIFTIDDVSDASDYIWSVPPGFEIEFGRNTTSIGVKALSGTAKGNIEVRASNVLGKGDPLTRSITSSKAPATINLEERTLVYDGKAKSQEITTIPGDLSLNVTYNGSISQPIDAGSYTIVTTVKDENYFGSTSDIFTIQKAPLVATADNLTRNYGDVNPPLTLYYSGFVNGETLTMIDDLPMTRTSASENSHVGVYPILVLGGYDNNYEFNVFSGELNIVKAHQFIDFPSLGDQVFDASRINLLATASSGLEVSFSVISGPANISDGTLIKTGPGEVTIEASQIGNKNYHATSTEQSFLIEQILGVQKEEKENFAVFPNPAKHQLNIMLPIFLSEADIELIDLLGKVVLKTRISNKAKLNLADLSSGVYLLRISDQKTKYSTKIIIR